MLLAEIHHKGFQEARDSEDYLTSTVFGHLRYLSPSVFWPDLFLAAVSLPSPGGRVTRLADTIAGTVGPLSDFDRIRAIFWPRHRSYGEPDLLLVFSVNDRPACVVLIEAKLWSGKSGTGENDQLARYLKLLDDPTGVEPPLPESVPSFLVYLTPRESFSEVEESSRWTEDVSFARDRLFRLRWQDVKDVAERALARLRDQPAATILRDVSRYLIAVGLEYFDGFNEINNLLDFEVEALRLAAPKHTFHGFRTLPDLEQIEVESGGWVS